MIRLDKAERAMSENGAGVDLARITDELEREGVQSFCDAYAQLLACIQERAAAGAPRTRDGSTSEDAGSPATPLAHLRSCPPGAGAGGT